MPIKDTGLSEPTFKSIWPKARFKSNLTKSDQTHAQRKAGGYTKLPRHSAEENAGLTKEVKRGQTVTSYAIEKRHQTVGLQGM